MSPPSAVLIRRSAVLATTGNNVHARAQARAAPPPPNQHDTDRCAALRIARAEIAAVQESQSVTCRNNYAQENLPRPIVPLVLSTGGVFQKTFWDFLEIMVPWAQDRKNVITDISLALVRHRALLYHRELPVQQ